MSQFLIRDIVENFGARFAPGSRPVYVGATEEQQACFDAPLLAEPGVEVGRPGRVYVTAFPNRAVMRRHLGKIAWKTEAWVADAPAHLIHFDGERLLGPAAA